MSQTAERNNHINETLVSELKISNTLALPRLVKISINIGLGDLKGNEALQTAVVANLNLITGQKPIMTRAKKAIAGFKIREKDLMGIPRDVARGTNE